MEKDRERVQGRGRRRGGPRNKGSRGGGGGGQNQHQQPRAQQQQHFQQIVQQPHAQNQSTNLQESVGAVRIQHNPGSLVNPSNQNPGQDQGQNQGDIQQQHLQQMYYNYMQQQQQPQKQRHSKRQGDRDRDKQSRRQGPVLNKAEDIDLSGIPPDLQDQLRLAQLPVPSSVANANANQHSNDPPVETMFPLVIPPFNLVSGAQLESLTAALTDNTCYTTIGMCSTSDVGKRAIVKGLCGQAEHLEMRPGSIVGLTVTPDRLIILDSNAILSPLRVLSTLNQTPQMQVITPPILNLQPGAADRSVEMYAIVQMSFLLRVCDVTVIVMESGPASVSVEILKILKTALILAKDNVISKHIVFVSSERSAEMMTKEQIYQSRKAVASVLSDVGVNSVKSLCGSFPEFKMQHTTVNFDTDDINSDHMSQIDVIARQLNFIALPVDVSDTTILSSCNSILRGVCGPNGHAQQQQNEMKWLKHCTVSCEDIISSDNMKKYSNLLT